MRTFSMLLLIFFLLPNAEAYAANSVITVVNDAGSETHFDPLKWKVVRRYSSTPKRKQKQCEPVIKWQTAATQTKTVNKVVFKRNKLSILAGYGPIGLITKQQGAERKVFQVDKEFGPVTGLRYTRNFSPIWSASAEYITNDTIVGAAGWSW